MIYKIEQNIVSHGLDFIIKDINDEEIFNVTEDISSISDVVNIFDTKGNNIITANKNLDSPFECYDIYSEEEYLGSVKLQTMLFKHIFVIEDNDEEYRLKGDFHSLEFDIFKGDNLVATVSNRALPLSNTYIVDIKEDKTTKLLLSSVIIIDKLLYDIGNNNQY